MSAVPDPVLPFGDAVAVDLDIDPIPPSSLDSVAVGRLSMVANQLAGTDGPTVIMGFPAELPRRPRQPISIESEHRGDEPLVDLLLGTVLPFHWRAVAVAGACRWYSADDYDRPGDGRVAIALDRAGRYSTAVVSGGETVTVGEGTGRVLDLVRRGFGLDTPGPVGSPVLFLRALWLDRIIDRATWDDALDWITLEQLQPRFGLAATWEDVHDAVGSGDLDVPGCPPELGRWFDAGSFSRCAADLLPSDHDLASTVAELLPPVLVGLVCDALRSEW